MMEATICLNQKQEAEKSDWTLKNLPELQKFTGVRNNLVGLKMNLTGPRNIGANSEFLAGELRNICTESEKLELIPE